MFAMPASGCELFRQWLHEDPEWGWMGWADCYHFTDTEAKDLGQARRTRQGLAVKGSAATYASREDSPGVDDSAKPRGEGWGGVIRRRMAAGNRSKHRP